MLSTVIWTPGDAQQHPLRMIQLKSPPDLIHFAPRGTPQGVRIDKRRPTMYGNTYRGMGTSGVLSRNGTRLTQLSTTNARARYARSQ